MEFRLVILQIVPKSNSHNSNALYFVSSIEGDRDRLHTAVLKEITGPWTYILAVGYSGGGAFDEFCGKFKWDSETDGFIGLFSNMYHDPDQWDHQYHYGETLESEIQIDESDRTAIQRMVAQLWDELIYMNETEDIRLIRPQLLERINTYQCIISAEWDADVVDWVSNELWGLNYRFDW